MGGTKRLTASRAAVLADGVYTDRQQPGLQLEVRGDARCWILRIQTGGRRTRLTLGHLDGMSLADARGGGPTSTRACIPRYRSAQGRRSTPVANYPSRDRIRARRTHGRRAGHGIYGTLC
jgi:hypothetical protein